MVDAGRIGAILVLACTVIAGCSGSHESRPRATSAVPAASTFPVRCVVVDARDAAIGQAHCQFRLGTLDVRVPVAADGVATQDVALGASGSLQAGAAGFVDKTVTLTVDGPKTIRFILEPSTPVAPPTTTDPSITPPANHSQPVGPSRTWGAPVTVVANPDGGYVSEPQLVVDGKGRVLYSPNSYGTGPYRSTDGGRTFQDIGANLKSPLPTTRTDSSVSLAPDGSLWYARSTVDTTNVLGCTSTDFGDSWTCDAAAMPGVTDRMWTVGVDAKTGYLGGLEPNLYSYLVPQVYFYYQAWFATTDGSTAYAPYGTTTDRAWPPGNMVYDAVHKQVWQVETYAGKLSVARVDDATGLVTWQDTGVPDTAAIPWIAAADGVLWTTGEPKRSDGSHGLVVARSTDQAATWKQLAIPTTAKTVAFSYSAAAPGGRVAVAFYGSDVARPPGDNGGNWSLYVVETQDALAANPTWVETRVVPLVHVGSICTGASCESTGTDPYARYSLDMIGIALDGDGNAHVAYVDDLDGHRIHDDYVRQTVP
ncbi:MAG: sialidase family protein [bacterium]